MLISDARYFKPQVITALFRANKIISEDEAVKKLNPVASDKIDGCQIFIFAVLYEDFRTQRHAPDHLQLKIGSANAIQARREIDFYNQIALPMWKRLPDVNLHFPQSYDFYIDDATEQFHLVLGGISPEFAPARNKIPPTGRHREQVIDTLAMLHAYWWDHPLLGEVKPHATDKMLNERLEKLQDRFAVLRKAVGSYLDKKYLDTLKQIATMIPEKRKTRLLSGQGLTITHGNLVPENLLYSNRDTMIINWQHWTAGFGTDDLAMMIPLHWTDDLRTFQELPLLKRYYSTITKNQVSHYSWADLEYDYRASLADIISNMLLKWTLDEHTRGHWRVMEKAMDRFIEMNGESIYI